MSKYAPCGLHSELTWSRNATEKTIEGDLFTAFVAAGAISKANANDPKKSALVRCARTDKGVHAAGNIISLKLQDEEEDIVKKINDNLSPQIRVWGIQRTVNSFSCYQACDSRWYEYLIPSHAFLPPHPSTFLGKKLPELAEECGDLEDYKSRQAEVATFWDETEEKYIAPILAELEEPIITLVRQALLDIDESAEGSQDAEPDVAAEKVLESSETNDAVPLSDAVPGTSENIQNDEVPGPVPALSTSENLGKPHSKDAGIPAVGTEERRQLDTAVKSLRKGYTEAKKAYRIPSERMDRIEAVLKLFLGTRNFHNYTIQKTFFDASAKRVIRSFNLNRTPIIVQGTEWLSFKIHGQSFMMHQIRKMVAAIALVVRSGCLPERIVESFANVDVSIPKVPGLGLLLERPVFDSYNAGPAAKFARDKIDFTKYEDEMLEFKQREIYERIFREEQATNAFSIFFNHVDHLKEIQLLYLSSKGMDASKGWKSRAHGAIKRAEAIDSDDEAADGKEEG